MSEIIKPEDVPDEMVEHYLSTNLGISWKHLIASDMNAAIKAGLVSPPCHVKRHLGDMQPPFEGPTERIEPILDPDRLMATARWFLNNSYKDTYEIIAYLIACHCGDSREAKPYKLKGGDSEAIPKLLLPDQDRGKECREIVRRLAENEEMRADEWVRLIVDAKELWAEMKGSEE